MILVSLTLLVAVFGPALAPFDPTAIFARDRLRPPGPPYWLGTDELGRDVLSRLLYGARISVLLSVVVVALASAIGIPAGLVAGYYRGALDWVLSRCMDALFAFPVILLALALVAVLGSDTRNLVIALTIVFVPGSTRLTRAATLAASRQEFIEAARSSGASDVRIMFRHVVPNILAVVFVQVTLILAFAMLVEASLSFLGLGVQPPAASWGSMLNGNKASLQQGPWASLMPGLCIILAVLGFNLLGDGLRDTLDPSLQQSN